MKKTIFRVSSTVAALSFLAWAPTSLAQTTAAPAAPSSTAPTAAPSATPSAAGASTTPSDASATPAAPAAQEPVDQARIHYERGAQLYFDNDFSGAVVELERAYSLAPSYKILYNLGRAYRRLNNYPQALTAFQRYLAEGTDVPDERRQEVLKEIETLKARVALVEIHTNVDGAELAVDQVPLSKQIGQTATANLNPGRHTISARKEGYLPASSYVTVVSGDAVKVELSLRSVGPEQAADNTPRIRAIVGWSGTAALGIGAGIAGGFALGAQSTLKNDRGVAGVAPSKLTSDANQLRTVSILADSLTAAAIVAGGISVYLTVKASKGEAPTHPAATASDWRVNIGAGRIGLEGSF